MRRRERPTPEQLVCKLRGCRCDVDRRPYDRRGMLGAPPVAYQNRGGLFVHRTWQIGGRTATWTFRSRLRDELLACEEFFDLAEARAAATRYRLEYDHRRPYLALEYLRPVDYNCGEPAV